MIPLTAKEVEAALKRNGFTLARSVGSHFHWVNRESSKFTRNWLGIFDIIGGGMGSLCLRTTLLERRNYAGNGMGVGSFYLKEVA